MLENHRLRLTGLIGLLPLAIIPCVAVGNGFPYPDDSLDGQTYLAYAVPRGELQIIFALVFQLSIALFLWLLALTVVSRSGRLGLAPLAMIGGGIGFVASFMTWSAVYLEIVMMGRVHPDLRDDHAALLIVSNSWNLIQVNYTISLIPLGFSWAAFAIANREHHILPAWLGTWGSWLVTAVSIPQIAFIFIHTGPWSPTSLGPFLLQAIPMCAWTTAAGIAFIRRGRAQPPGSHGPAPAGR
ncbi:hypothetical protein ACFWJT_04710 [Streptomyces sp. NPDC127069]|uniref:hypothetical protein n=1 Tax=Streptomyces sp. NPDC127069 TaxID=3347128 RepID=UPI00366672E1